MLGGMIIDRGMSYHGKMRDATWTTHFRKFSASNEIYSSRIYRMAQQFMQYGPQAAKLAVVGSTAVFGTYWMATNCLYNGMIV